MKKPKSRRDKVKHPNLNPRFSPRIRGEFIDYDYVDKLDDKTKDWLNKFTGEYHGASFQHNETDIQPYEKYGKDCNDRNNFANRDTYGILKNKANKSNNKRLLNYDNVIGDIESNSEANPSHLENSYIDFIDLKEVEHFLEEYDLAMSEFSEVLEIPTQLP